MGSKSAGGVIVALAGAVLVVAGLRGTLGNVWKALIGPPDTQIGSVLGGKTPSTTTPDTTAPGTSILPAGYPGTLAGTTGQL